MISEGLCGRLKNMRARKVRISAIEGTSAATASGGDWRVGTRFVPFAAYGPKQVCG